MLLRLVLASVLLALLAARPAAAQESWSPDPKLLARAKALLAQVPVIDGHNDLPSAILGQGAGDLTRLDLARPQPQLHTDLARLKQGQVGAQFWAAYVTVDSIPAKAALRHALREIDMVQRMTQRYAELELARTAADIERIQKAGKTASLIGVEGGHALEGSLSALREFHELGVRYLTLTHSRTHEWADASTDYPQHNGLSEFGEEVVREMNRLGIFVDLSHVSAETMKDALRVSAAPVIFSHSSARALVDHPRNVPDDVLRLVPRNGGVVMVNFCPCFIAPNAVRWVEQRDSVREQLQRELDSRAEIARRTREWLRAHPRPRGSVADVADHIDHIRRVAGIDHVGLGSDFDGFDDTPVGLEDVSMFPNLIAELLRRGYSDEDVKKIAGLNLLRAMRQMEQVAARLRAERPASLADTAAALSRN
ncbi:MAG: membrane dipeptidase [Gemmatimonadetes bacterium]|nr:membrane dipeptidase [Gemmatimonadota bacterium]